MQLRSNVSLDEGHRNLKKIIKEIGEKTDWNEADTRFHIIDRILTECLGWSKQPERFKLEEYQDGDYRDYVLGNPEVVVWEAKRCGIHFDYPADIEKKSVQSIKSILEVSKSADAAIRQVQSYCNSSGIEFGVVCNGHQLIAFAAIRIGQSWLNGSALVIRSLSHLDEEFGLVWQCLSPDGVAEKRLLSLLNTGATRSIPRKLSSQLLRFPSFRYKTPLQSNLRDLAELLIEDTVSTEKIRPQFYKECYCDTGALSRDALVSKQMLEARYSALFGADDNAPQLEPAAKKGDELSLSDQIMSEAIARRPIVLLGDVGVGKTSFLENLMYVRAADEFDKAISIYLDLGSKAALEVDIKAFTVAEIEQQLYAKYSIDINEYSFVRGVYDLEVKRFRSSYKAVIYKKNKEKLDEELAARIDQLVNNKPEHLRRSIEHVALARKRQIIIVLDNADQRALDVQQSAFIISQDFARNWNALVFIAVRPQTFFQSKRSGALSAYPNKVFTILPPRPELVIEKRLAFAVKIAQGQVEVNNLQGIRLSLNGIATFLRVLLFSIEKNRDLTEILSNITAGNIRSVIEFITHFIGSPNVDANKIVDLYGSKGDYVIPIHEFSKAAILGDYSHYVPESSLAMNLFDVQSMDRKEHFLAPLIASFIYSQCSLKDKDGFVSTCYITQEMQDWGYLPDQTEKTLRKLTNKRLIETTERITFEEDLVGLIGDIPHGFRTTSIGAYHLNRWIGVFAYLDAMVFDTPIFDQIFLEQIGENVGSYDIVDRYNRTLHFRNYLSSAWEESGLHPQYFNWNDAVTYGQPTFDAVNRAITRLRNSGNETTNIKRTNQRYR